MASSHARRDSDATLRLWNEYRRTGDTALRDRIVLTFAPLVKYIVYRKVREMPARCDVDDFISVGLEALMRSIDRFDPSKGATLEQYAWTRIHGAVLDELRRNDWAPRSVRRWERDIEKASEEFTALHGRHPTEDELCEALACEKRELRQRKVEISRSDVTSLNTLVVGDEETSIERIDTLPCPDDRLDPEHAAHITAGKERFREAFAELSRREREVVVLLYVKGMTLAEIGSILGVSESRVCQIHTQLKKRLRSSLNEDATMLQMVA
jgi:RNA polymerase sigma factor for flagellar operon FliA